MKHEVGQAKFAQVDGQVALEAWLQVSHALTRDLPLPQVLDVIAQVARDLSGNLFAMVALVDESGTRLVVRGAAGLPPEYLAVANDEAPLLLKPPRGRAETPSARAFRTGKPVAIPNLLVDDTYADYREAALRQGYSAIQSVPLAGPGELGVLTVYAASPALFGPSQSDLLLALARGAAAAIEIARLREREVVMRAELQEVDRMHQRLTRIALANRGMDPIIRSVAEMTGYDMHLRDGLTGDVLSAWPPRHAGPNLDRDTVNSLKEQADRTKELVVHQPADGAPVYLVPIIIGGEATAHLWADAEGPPMTTPQARVLERGAMVVALEMLKQRHTEEVDWRMRGDLLRDLLAAKTGEQLSQLAARARSYGVDLTKPHAMLVARPDPPHRATSATAPPSVPEAALERLIANVRTIVSRAPVHALVETRDGAVHVLWPDPTGSGPSAVRLAQDIQSSMTSRGAGGWSASVAIADACKNPAEYRTAARLASGALRITQDAGARGRTVKVSDLGMYQLLLAVDDPKILRDYAERMIGPLRQQELRNADLVTTLRCYLENDMRSDRTAEQLHVHLNTLAYRLRRIESLTGASLRSSQGLLELSFATTLDRLIGSEPHLAEPTTQEPPVHVQQP